MPSREAVRKCPHLIILPPRFEAYKAESNVIHRVFQKYAEIIEPLSLDEAYLDVTSSTQNHDEAVTLAKQIKKEISRQTGLSVSAGIAKNKFLAKICSDWKKPNGLFSIAPELSKPFARQLKMSRIPGVGKVTEEKMSGLGIHLVSDLETLSRRELEKHFGKFAGKLLGYLNGEDDRPVEHRIERKSLGCEQTFNSNFATIDGAHAQIHELYEDLHQQLMKRSDLQRISGHFVKVKFHDFSQTTLERKAEGVPDLDRLFEMFKEAWKRKEEPFRLLGLGVRLNAETKTVEHDSQLNFFESD